MGTDSADLFKLLIYHWAFVCWIANLFCTIHRCIKAQKEKFIGHFCIEFAVRLDIYWVDGGSNLGHYGIKPYKKSYEIHDY